MSAFNFWFPIAFVLAVVAARLLELRKKRDTISGPARDSLSFQLFLAVGVLMLISSLIEYVMAGKSLSIPFLVMGAVSAFISISLRLSAIKALGEFWSLHVEIREQHQMVQNGPFRWVRHPTYLSMIFELLAIGLTLQAFFSLLIIPFLYVPALIYRLKLEEAALIAKFGDAYRDYQKRVPMLFPIRIPR